MLVRLGESNTYPLFTKDHTDHLIPDPSTGGLNALGLSRSVAIKPKKHDSPRQSRQLATRDLLRGPQRLAVAFGTCRDCWALWRTVLRDVQTR